MSTLLDAATEVAAQLGTAPGKPVTIHQPEAEYLLSLPFQLLNDITQLAIRRVQMHDGHDYMQRGDIDWAWARLMVGTRSDAWTVVLNSVSSVLLGAGIPIVVSPFIAKTSLSESSLLIALCLIVPGLVGMSLALAYSVFRRR